MQFLIIGRDGTDDKAMERRLAARLAHIEMGEKLRQAGNMWYGAVFWDDNQQMIGSMYLMDFPSEKELHEWLDVEPYITGKVWEKLEIQRRNVRDPWQFNRPKEWFEARQVE
jgi:uncharacterized protein YciI